MRFRVGRDALGEAVAFVSRALPSRPVVPLLSGMLLRATADGVVLSCFDYEVSARARMDADVEEQGTALVPGRLLAEITRSLPARPAEFSEEGEVVRLACGRAEFELVCLPVAEYPELPPSPPPVGVLDGGVLAGAIGQVAPAASRDDTLPMLTALCLDVSGEVLTLAATDRYRLAAREVPFAPAEPGVRGIALAPARFMVDSVRMLAAGVPVTVAFGAEPPSRGEAEAGRTAGEPPDRARSADPAPRPAEGLVSLETPDRRLTARLIGGEFIKYRSRFPGEFGCRAEIPADLLIEAVRRAALVAERAGPVRLSFGQGRVTIEAQDEGRARAAETIPASFSGDQPVISFNPHYLLDGLTAAAAEEAGHVRPSGPVRPHGTPRGRAGEDGADDGGAGDAGAGDAGAGDAGAGDAGEAAGAAEPGRIRLEFTSPAKPALVTWAGADGQVPGAESAGGTRDGGGAGTADGEAGSADGEAGDEGSGVPAFRYLVVPLRVPVRG